MGGLFRMRMPRSPTRRPLLKRAAATCILLILGSCNPYQQEAIRSAFGPAAFDKGEYYYSFEGLRIAITEAVQFESGGVSRFRTYWAVVNRDSDRKYVAISLTPSETYILPARTTAAIPLKATGITVCGSWGGYHQRPGCSDYTSVYPDQALTFILETGPQAITLKDQAISVRARFTLYEDSRLPGKSTPANVDVEFNDISLRSAPWQPE